jgi:hypothetical protein
MLPLYVKGKKPTGDSVTGKAVTNPAIVALDPSIAVAYRWLTAEIPSLTEEREKLQRQYGMFCIMG